MRSNRSEGAARNVQMFFLALVARLSVLLVFVAYNQRFRHCSTALSPFCVCFELISFLIFDFFSFASLFPSFFYSGKLIDGTSHFRCLLETHVFT